jgi:hypothetical protein
MYELDESDMAIPHPWISSESISGVSKNVILEIQGDSRVNNFD